MKYGDVSQGLAKNERPLRLDLYRPKTGTEYYTFLGKDAVSALKVYLKDAESREIKFESKSPLFVTEKGKEPLDTNNVQNMLKEVAVKSGLVDEKMNGNAFNPLSPHALRESFGSIMTNSGVPDTVVDFWLGHEIGEMAEAYKSVQFESLRKMYLEREKLLSISQGPIDAEEIERKVDDRIQSLQKIITNFSAENLTLKTTVEVMKKQLDSLKAELQDERTLRESTESAFNKTVDKLIARIKNLERELDLEGEENNQKNPLADS